MSASPIKASSQDIKFDKAGESESSRPVQTCNTPSGSGSVEPTTTSTTTKAPSSTKSNSSTIPDATQDVAASDLSLSSLVVRSVMVPLPSLSFCQPPSHAHGTCQDGRQPPLTGTPSAVGAILSHPQSLLAKRHIIMKLDSDCLDSDTLDAEREEFEREEAYLLLKVARTQTNVQQLEQHLAGAKMEEHTATGNLYKHWAQETDRRLEVAETKLGSIRNLIQMGGGTLCDFSSQKHLHTSHDMLAVTNRLLMKPLEQPPKNPPAAASSATGTTGGKNIKIQWEKNYAYWTDRLIEWC
ncbi:hypothetical protein L210DRAFT_3509857 [Boletus edulis BED1]|uniref:Uncharacterized protein n=1 Tax=Boletus edulis BED1 TaxID=1328754 RepID=A0AAD4G6Q7_BOLED|nr:hypothetical protein L210DRAFT_3509857 [Boletus edulis BED1]